MRKATLQDKQLVSQILVSAFAPLTEQNSINLIVKQDSKRIARMHVLMDYLFLRAMRQGAVYLSDNEKSCILLQEEHHPRTSLQSIKEDLTLVRKCIGISRLVGALKRQRAVHRHYPQSPHIRPVILGAMPEVKGNGSAARLLIEVYQKYKDSPLPVVLDVAAPKNIKLYKKFGFKVISKEESLGFPIHFMRLH